MKKHFLIGMCALPLAAGAQQLQTGDVVFPESNQLPNYVEAWNGGGGNIQVTYTNGSGDKVTVDWEDEEFFTSRVKPRKRISASTMNVNDFGSKAGRRSMWWVPIDDPATQGLPNGRFNSEAFSMWSYIDVYGQWTAPYGWVTGAFADICHKNGVATGGQASMPWAGFTGSAWETCMNAMAAKYGSDAGAEVLGKFLLYHGVDGLGYNSESGGWSGIIQNIRNMHAGLMKYMAAMDRNPVFENIWYAGTNDAGNLAFDRFLVDKQKLYASASMFSNYNWTSPSGMAAAVERANSVNDYAGNPRTSWYMYAGMNQQGGEPKFGENYPMLKDYDWSMGWWGAHSNNMFWEGRGAHGTTDDVVMAGYLKDCEQFWGNGPRNPAIHKEIKTVRAHRPSDEFHGVAEFINERSVLDNKLASEPFYTFFNLGNGKFFNWKGERMNDNEWYSIGVQDYLPTWRFWTAPTWMQRTVEEGTVNLNVGFTYEDAFFGGSCLKIEGTTDTEYLHLFKSAMTGLGSKTVTVRYKLLEGTGDVRLVLTSVNTPDKEPALAALKQLQVFTTDECSDLENESYREGAAGWQTKTFRLTATAGNNTNMPGGLGVIGLEVKNAKGLKLLLGELSIMAASNTKTPEAPVIRSSKVLRNNFSGVDGKIIWTMDNDVARQSGTPKYNSDVNASMYKVWSREEGGEAQFLGVTTSWAAIAFRAPNTDDSKKIQFGVSAVSADTRSESAITWGNLLEKGTYQVSEGIALSKLTIKPGEEFSVYFTDKRHAPVDWAIKTQAGETLVSGNGISLEVPNGLPEVGGYDLVCGDKQYNYYIQISDEKVGALPEIYSISNENGTVESAGEVSVKLEDHPQLAYTGRRADGSASRGVNLNSIYMGAKIGDMGLDAHQSFSVSAWLRIKELPKLYYLLFDISNKADGWPINTWGWMWCHGLPDGRMYTTYRGNSNGSASPGELHYTYPSLRIQPGVWTHFCWVQEYDGEKGFRHFLYVNGVKQESKVFSYLLGGDSGSGCRILGDGTALSWHTDELGDFEGDNDGDIWIDNQTHPLSAADWAYFGGQAHTGSAADAVIDDYQIWNKALTADEVKVAMNGLDLSNGTPEKLLCYWDFESEANSEHWFASAGNKSGVQAASYDLVHEGGNPEAASVPQAMPPVFEQGCPFLEGTAYPVVTKAQWSDNLDRKTGFAKSGADREDESGSAVVTFNKGGDHTITLNLSNTYGSDSRTFPVYKVDATGAIDGVGADAEGVRTYTVDRTLFVEFDAAGAYTVQVYNAAGMMAANTVLNAAAGQMARIDLAAAGVYIVKVTRDGRELRTLKLIAR